MCGNRCTGSGVGGACSLLGSKHLSPGDYPNPKTPSKPSHPFPPHPSKGKTGRSEKTATARERRVSTPFASNGFTESDLCHRQSQGRGGHKCQAGRHPSERQTQGPPQPWTTLDLPKSVWKQGWKKVSGSWHSGQLAWCVGVDGWCWGFRCHLEDLEKETRWSGVWNTEALRLAKENSRPSIRPEAPTTEVFQVSGWNWTITQSGGSQTAGRGHICSEPTEPGVLSRRMWGFRRDEKESGPQQVWDEQPRHRPFRLRFITPGTEGQRPPCGDQSSPDTDTSGTHKLAQATGHCPSTLQSVLKHTHTVKFQRKLTLLLYPPRKQTLKW